MDDRQATKAYWLDWSARVDRDDLEGEVVEAEPYTAHAPLENAAALNGNIALVGRRERSQRRFERDAVLRPVASVNVQHGDVVLVPVEERGVRGDVDRRLGGAMSEEWPLSGARRGRLGRRPRGGRSRRLPPRLRRQLARAPIGRRSSAAGLRSGRCRSTAAGPTETASAGR